MVVALLILVSAKVQRLKTVDLDFRLDNTPPPLFVNICLKTIVIKILFGRIYIESILWRTGTACVSPDGHWRLSWLIVLDPVSSSLPSCSYQHHYCSNPHLILTK